MAFGEGLAMRSKVEGEDETLEVESKVGGKVDEAEIPGDVVHGKEEEDYLEGGGEERRMG